MKINLTTNECRQEIARARRQFTSEGSLAKFDDFISRNDVFDFNNDEHVRALRKGGDNGGTGCTCNITISPVFNFQQ